MNIAAYCRVSTEKEDQLNSLEAQKQFFTEYTKRTGDVLVRLYADEGISGTKTKNRKEFMRMMADADKGLFDMVVGKDISRFARNTADFSSALFLLRNCQVTIFFEKENLDSAELKNEFILSVLGAFAQEESRSISSNIMEGNKMRNSQGDVRNVKLYGYRFSGNWICNETG